MEALNKFTKHTAAVFQDAKSKLTKATNTLAEKVSIVFKRTDKIGAPEVVKDKRLYGLYGAMKIQLTAEAKVEKLLKQLQNDPANEELKAQLASAQKDLRISEANVKLQGAIADLKVARENSYDSEARLQAEVDKITELVKQACIE